MSARRHTEAGSHGRFPGRPGDLGHAVLAAALLFVSSATLPAVQLRAQQGSGAGLSVERIYGTADFSPERLSATWRAGGEHWVTVETGDDGRQELWQVEAGSGRRELLVAADELVPAGESEPVRVFDLQFSPDGRRLLLFTDAREVWRDRTRGRYYVFDLETRDLHPLSREPGWQMFAKFSPDGQRVGFVRQHDLFVVDLSTGRERALTETGSEDIINGTTDWVYEEELGLRDAWRWSPDGSRIAFWQLDQSPVRPFPLVDESSVYPEIRVVRYPKAGTANSRVRVGVLGLDGGGITWMETGPDTGQYVPRMDWVDSTTLGIQRLNRHQNRLEVLRGDAVTGSTEVSVVDRDSAWVDVDDHYRWLGDGRLLWSSERDGHNHLYLFDRNGELVRQLTSGGWDVTDVYGVDEGRGRVFFQAARESPMSRQVMAVGLDGTGLRTVAGGGGWHDAQFSPGFGRFLDTHSTAASPPRVVLREADGTAVRTVVENAELRARVDSLGLRPPEFTELPAADGTSLNAWIVRPPAFDSAGAHPLLMYAYGGPGAQTVTDRWGGRRYLWHQLLAARHGVVVASVDNRGTGGRGRDFTKQTYLRLGALESADQLAAREELASRGWVDGDRTALWGWSYGGYLTLLTLLRGPGAFAAGVSVAPVTHWKFYDTIYTERYMRTPRENPEGYRESAPLNYAGRLESELLLVHGTGDDNVHFQNTSMMVKALEEANEQFRLRIYPGKQHAIGGSLTRVNLFRMITDHLVEELDAR